MEKISYFTKKKMTLLYAMYGNGKNNLLLWNRGNIKFIVIKYLAISDEIKIINLVIMSSQMN